ncbi:MAG: hypothetical protein WC393_00850 [Candidatus Nanoarchaeia archaeon]
MLNWRKPIIYALLYLTGSKVPGILKEIQRVDNLSESEIKKYQNEKLKKMLLHAYNNVPYYHKILEEAEVVKNGKVNLANFHKIPILTKDIIRKEGNNMYSKDYLQRKPHPNTSGGSTGEPLQLIQDKEYDDINYLANKIYFQLVNGKDIGELEMNLWGSMRDIQRNHFGFKERFTNFLYNRIILNTFKMDENDMKRFTEQINKKKPVSMWVFSESLETFCKFIKQNNIKITHSPKFILSTAGTLYPEVKKLAEEIFKCPVLNQYGSREVGAMAVECKYNTGLHGFPWSHYIEVINNEIVVTLLTNYSMPLIRYKIGDYGSLVKNKSCKCGRNSLTFKKVDGKTISFFKKKNGELLSAQYFIRLFFFWNWIKQFKLIQKDYDLIEFRVVLNKEANKANMKYFEEETKKVMGNKCKVKWNFVKKIEPTISGKYIYTVSEIK